MEETIYLEPVIEEEELMDLEEDSALVNVNATCGALCSGGSKDKSVEIKNIA